MPFTTGTRAPLWWEESGDGEPVLLVMGHMFGLEMWHRVRPALAERYRVICFDNRGVGRSGRARGPYRIAEMAADSFAVLDAAGFASAHLYGASMGGLVVQEMALSRPDRVRSLVLACTGCPSDETVPKGRPGSWLFRVPTRLLAPVLRRSMRSPGVAEQLIDEDVRIIVNTRKSAAALTEQARAIADYRSRDRVGAITAPTLVLHGTADIVVDYERGVELARSIPGARLHTLDGADHNYARDAGREANDAVLRFLADVEADASGDGGTDYSRDPQPIVRPGGGTVPMSHLHDLNAVDQVVAVLRGEVSPTDLVEHYLDRIGRHAEALGAFVTVTADLARADAKDAERRLLEADGEELPRLVGLPFAFKDLHAVGGVRTTFGCKPLENYVPDDDAWTVGLLRRAGVSTLGTTHAPEFGPTCYTESDVVAQPAVTPYDVGRYASGSSGGAAAAVAAGLLPAAHSSDGAGSTRTPAAVCGLVGFKATRAHVSLAPATSFVSWGIEGPLARSVADAALLLDVMANPPASDLYGWVKAAGTSYADAAQRDPDRPLRVLAYTDAGLDVEPHADVVAGVREAVTLLEKLGHDVAWITNPAPWDESLLEAMLDAFAASIGATVPAVVPAESHDLLRPFTRWLLERSAALSAVNYLAVSGALATAASTHLAAAAAADIVLTPTTTQPAVPVGWFDQDGIDEVGRRMLGWSAYTPWANMTGQPAVSLPLHASADGLPVGVQLTAARRGDDALLISVAGQLERAAPWQHRRPPQWDS